MAKIYKIDRPLNPNLPYFAYDAFKPGQVAFPIIKHFIIDIKYGDVNYQLKQRNGNPLVVDERGYFKTYGYLIYFNNEFVAVNHEDGPYDAYDFIRSTKSKSLYNWHEVNINGERANILVSKNRNFGEPFTENNGIYEGRNDKGFYGPLEYIYNHKEEVNEYYDYNSFYKLQMLYMLLWSSIDKYLSLSYGGWDQRKNIIEWSKCQEFKCAIENNVHGSHENAYSSQGAKSYAFNINNPQSCAEYYYQVRCNVVHSGKNNYKDFNNLNQSLNELLYIFWDVLDDSFNDEDEIMRSFRNW